MISALLNRWWRLLADAAQTDHLQIVVAPRLISEFLAVSARPRLLPHIAAEDRAELLDLLERAPSFGHTTPVTVCRDPEDDYLLALAKAAEADILVTRDEDLLVLGRYGRTEIVYPAEFLRRLSEIQT